ncbi:hypothetical protein QG516_03665 [Pedobacter gandavensis]|uniref:hypothetical protein n=1 Tax=Pedobacter gandavensis TaxID=2679963 RepID=UPI00247AA8F5|nr:hypothetical protein [Pedobacter gandavensis]WGQ10751.1 hypothetical protein QG516_03665 [Pedobacter gandavensis]
MNTISSNIKKIALSLLVVGLAVGFSAFKPETNKLRAGDYMFYNRTQNIHNSDLTKYVFRSTPSCNVSGVVCTEIWNIGSQTPPTDGKELSSYTIAPTYVGSVVAGTYNGL